MGVLASCAGNAEQRYASTDKDKALELPFGVPTASIEFHLTFISLKYSRPMFLTDM
jgi:hypothetical protein